MFRQGPILLQPKQQITWGFQQYIGTDWYYRLYISEPFLVHPQFPHLWIDAEESVSGWVYTNSWILN